MSVIVYDSEEERSYVPDSLKYVRVITTTTGNSVDSDEKVEAEQSVTITLLVSPEQANDPAYFNSTSTLHFTLVFRDGKEVAEKYLKEQDKPSQEKELAS